MSETITTPLDWIKQIPTAILQLDDFPLLGTPPTFPWDVFILELEKVFEIQGLKIEPQDIQWRTPEELGSGIGSYFPLTLTVSPIEDKLHWIMSEQDIRQLTGMLLEQGKITDLIDEDFQKGFYHFLAYEVIFALANVPFDKTLVPQIDKESTLPLELAVLIRKSRA